MVDNLAARVDRLEREARRWRRAAVGMALCLCGGLLGAAPLLDKLERLEADVVNATVSVAAPNLAATNRDGGGAVRIHSSEQVGQTIVMSGAGRGGVDRISLMVDPDGAASLTFADKKGNPRLMLGVNDEGEPSVKMLDEKSNPRAALTLDDADALLLFLDPEGKAVYGIPPSVMKPDPEPKRP